MIEPSLFSLFSDLAGGRAESETRGFLLGRWSFSVSSFLTFESDSRRSTFFVSEGAYEILSEIVTENGDNDLPYAAPADGRYVS